ncbi:MAG TPA: hypothetical protein ENJ94_02200, partial [Gammaproteobacteria bacterium]|nr:hypothetical protein [Gammaproteobacteria bacterium]
MSLLPLSGARWKKAVGYPGAQRQGHRRNPQRSFRRRWPPSQKRGPAGPGNRNMIKTSVIGLGAMGAGIAGNLHRAGLLAAAWNRTPERGQAAAEQHGFRFTPHLQAAVQCADLVITSVSADEDLLEMTFRIAPLLQAGNVVLDTSTVSVQTAQRAAEIYEAHGVHFLDAPVSGGKEGAERGTLSM